MFEFEFILATYSSILSKMCFSRLFGYKRNDSIRDYGVNKFLCWRSNGAGIAVVTDKGFIILFQVADVSRLVFLIQYLLSPSFCLFSGYDLSLLIPHLLISIISHNRSGLTSPVPILTSSPKTERSYQIPPL